MGTPRLLAWTTSQWAAKAVSWLGKLYAKLPSLPWTRRDPTDWGCLERFHGRLLSADMIDELFELPGCSWVRVLDDENLAGTGVERTRVNVCVHGSEERVVRVWRG